MKTRRDFIKAGFAVGATFSLPTLGGLFAADAPAKTNPAATPDLIAVRDGDRVSMLKRAIESLGGMSTFVKKGQKVVIKPNIGWDVRPELGANTHPDIITGLIALCQTAGASEISVFDHTCDPWERAYKTSGIAEAAKTAGARVLPGHDESYYREVAIPNGVSLKTVKIHSAILDSDVFINAPVLKHHSGATMSACIKNLMGMIWDRKFYHQNDLQQCIADILSVKKPNLNILDAYHPMARNGPHGKTAADLLDTKTLLASTDIVAIDAAASRILGHKANAIEHVRIAADAGYGRLDLDKLNIERVKMAV